MCTPLLLGGKVQYSGSVFSWIFMKQDMKLRGWRITVLQAPEPSTILWENYGFAW